MQAYGEEGVVKAVRILEREIVRGMQLLGASNVKQLVPAMVSSTLSSLASIAHASAQVERIDWQPVTARL